MTGRRTMPATGARDTSYLEQPLGQFLDLVASKEPAPGGGAVAAVTVALAAGLVGMAARFSEGRLPESERLADAADSLRHRAALLAEEDAEAYRAVLAALTLPREPDPESRRARVREALQQAAEVPLCIAVIGAEVAERAAQLADQGNPNLRGDAVTAALVAEAAVRSAAELVRINVEMGKLDVDLLRAADRHVRAAAGAAHQAGAVVREAEP